MKKELTIADFHKGMRVKYRGVEGLVVEVAIHKVTVVFAEEISYPGYAHYSTSWRFGGDCKEPLSALEIITEPKEINQSNDDKATIEKVSDDYPTYNYYQALVDNVKLTLNNIDNNLADFKFSTEMLVKYIEEIKNDNTNI